jgi:hypothetical protein
MKRKNLVLGVAATIGIMAWFTLESRAEDGPAVPAEPKDAAEVFERYAKAVGGKEAINAIKSRVSKGQVEISQYNISGKTETLQKAPNLFAASTTLDMGSFDRVFNGATAWSKNPMSGLKVETGIELANIKEEAELHLPARMKEFFPGAKLQRKQKRENADVYVVELLGSDKPNEAYFDTKTGLLVGWKRQVQTESGPGTSDQTLQDYRAVGAVKVPFLITTVLPNATVVTKVSEVKHNVDIPDTKFAKP